MRAKRSVTLIRCLAATRCCLLGSTQPTAIPRGQSRPQWLSSLFAMTSTRVCDKLMKLKYSQGCNTRFLIGLNWLVLVGLVQLGTNGNQLVQMCNIPVNQINPALWYFQLKKISYWFNCSFCPNVLLSSRWFLLLCRDEQISSNWDTQISEYNWIPKT